MALSAHVPDLAALELLLGVATAGSLNGAARQAGVSQQAVSARIAAMEAQTGVTLVHRTPRGSSLTAEGIVIAEWAARLLDVAAGLDAGIAALRADRRARLRVSASSTIAEQLLPAWLASFRAAAGHPGSPALDVVLTAVNSETAYWIITRLGERQAHDEGVPELAVGPPVVLDAVPFVDEAALAVQGDPGRVVREYFEAELVQALGAGPGDGRLDQGRADPAAAPLAVDQHPEFADAIPPDAGVDVADDLAVGHRDDRLGNAGAELRGPLLDVDRRLGGDPRPFLGYGREELSHRPGVGYRCRSHGELCHHTSRM